MTAAKVLDVIARRLGSAGQASDAVSAYVQVKMEGAATLLTLPKSECPDIWIRLPRQMAKITYTTSQTAAKTWQNIE